ncbi:hypothetical protein COZ41_02120 [Candidatus Shapirobacteria bacterium CG_4_10_14_3_um_filter_35_13]|uniref:Diacylglycerol glucosyltransferase N-terminal domain-containing protein n=1 Tax=Candidatus Shapirobacteria bacterium CG_4_10_14_3_um_filter_35_13 TaxID=1974873 RepID=A0A2M7LIU2_9BACT|nr:MAG: hypothetical protein COZ41_02120 [Candidatus Shapirobacteria bacterium CG_4_10_14_3_um_filter_35_13]
MKKKRILVLTDDMPWGHRSIAKAIYGFLKTKEKDNQIEVSYAEVKAPIEILNDLYIFAYRFFSLSNRISLKLMENKRFKKTFLEMMENNLPELKKIVNKIKPDLIISSYFFHSQSLAKWEEETRGQFKLWTIVADPWSNNSLSFMDGADLHLVYDDVAYKQAINYGIPKENIIKTGWWTRQEMYNFQKTNLQFPIKQKMGIEEGESVVFVGGGSLGTNAITKFLPVLLLIKQKCSIIFNTGTDKLAFKMVEQYKRIFEKININNKVRILNYGWIENMGEVLASCDIVFGKAGPNFLFDVVACQKPFVAITHIGGQEDGNIDLILKKKLGWVKEGLGEAEDFLIEYLKRPNKYKNKYAKTIEIEAKNNERTMERVWEKIKCPTKS